MKNCLRNARSISNIKKGPNNILAILKNELGIDYRQIIERVTIGREFQEICQSARNSVNIYRGTRTFVDIDVNLEAR